MKNAHQDPLEDLEQLYQAIDRAVARVVQRNAERLRCGRGCSACCSDELTVFTVEAENIRRHHARLLASDTPAPPGACAFLDEQGSCRIYAQRPYVCRTQGLPLRWIEELDDEAVVELRDICPLNEAGRPIEELDEDDCWTIGPFEERLAKLELRVSDGTPRREALRDLFETRESERES